MNRRQFAASAPLALVATVALGAPQPDIAMLFAEWKALYTVDHGSDEAQEAAVMRCNEIEGIMALIRAGNAQDLSMKILVASAMGEGSVDPESALGASLISDAVLFAGRAV